MIEKPKTLELERKEGYQLSDVLGHFTTLTDISPDMVTMPLISNRTVLARYLTLCQRKITPIFFGMLQRNIESLNTEKVGLISTSYQYESDKPTLYPIEKPKYLDVTVQLLILGLVLAVRRLVEI